MAALFLVDHMIDAGAVAIKGESAGVAHGVHRWRQLAAQAATAISEDEAFDQCRIGRLAFAKWPLSSATWLTSVGFHLVGLPDVQISMSLGDERAIVAMMDDIANDVARLGVDATLAMRHATLVADPDHEEDEFAFNPYGVIRLSDVSDVFEPSAART
jgi:hypothetical protein